MEKNTNGQGDLAVTITGTNWQGTMALTQKLVDERAYIYWTTTSKDGTKTWHHKGKISALDLNHPNHS